MMKPYVPVMAVKFCLSSVLPAVPSDVLDIPMQEVVRISAFKDSEETLRNTMNNTFFLRCLDRLAAPPRRSSLPGAESLYAREVREMWERKAKKVMAHMATWSKLKGMVTTSSGTMAHAVLSQGRSTVQYQVRNTYKIPGVGRRYASPIGAPHLSRRVRVMVLPDDVQDWDIVNAMVSLVTEVVPKTGLGPCGPLWAPTYLVRVRHASRQYSLMDGSFSRANSQGQA